MYKLAVQKRLRFMTPKGVLSVEQLFDLSIDELDKLAVALDEEYKKGTRGKTFLEQRNIKDEIVKLKADISLDVLRTKLAEEEARQDEAEKKNFNTKILELIAEKQDDELKGKSIAELRKMIKK